MELRDEIRDQALRGGAYLVVRQAVGMLVKFGGILLLTRLIGPTNYGLYTTAFAITTVLSTLAWVGVDAYLLRHEEELPRRAFDEAFSLLVVTSTLVVLVGLGAAFLAARMLPDTRFLPPLLAMLALLPVKVLWTPGQTLLERGFQYRRLAALELGADFAYYAVALPLAFYGGGVWAPVAGFGAWQGVLLVGSYALAGYRPRWRWNPRSVRDMLRYGSSYTASIWASDARELVNPIVVGGLLGPTAVGYVALAVRLVDALSFLRKITRRLALVALGKVQHDRRRMRRTVEEGMGLQVLALGPLLAGFAMVAPWFIPLAFGEQWRPTLAVFPLIAIGYLGMALFTLPAALLYVVRRSGAVAAGHTVQVVVLALGALVLVPPLGIVGYGLAEVLSLLGFVVIIRAARTVVSFSYGRGVPWVVALAPAVFTPLVAFPWSLLLWLPAVAVAAAPLGRAQLREYLGFVRQAMSSTTGRGGESGAQPKTVLPSQAPVAHAAELVATSPHERDASVSVVVPTYRRRHVLERLLPPLLDDPATLEVVVVVDGCNDGSFELLQRLATQDARIVPVRIENRGPAGARQAGVEVARGDIVLFLDDDVVAAPGLVTGHARRHHADQDLVVVGAMPTDAPVRRRPGMFASYLYDEEYERRRGRWLDNPSRLLTTLWNGNVSLRRENCLRVGLFNPALPRGYHEDRDFGLRCLKAGLQGVYEPALLARHEHRLDLRGFRRVARSQGKSRWLVHHLHSDVLGPLPVTAYENDLAAPLRLLVRASDARPIRAVVVAALMGLVRVAGLFRSYSVETGAARLLRRIDARAGARAAAHAEKGDGRFVDPALDDPRAELVRQPRVLIVVQNLSVPFDRRVWLEAKALVAAGFGVSVICPKAPGDASFEELEGVRIHRYAPPPTTSGTLSFAVEFAYCWVRTALLALRILRRDGFDAIQACNPPDTYFALAAPLKLLGKRFVFDQHDLCPEVYRARFGNDGGLLLRGLYRLERATYAVADHVIAPNESYRHVALARGQMPPERVTVVRNGPDTSRLRPGPPRPELKQGRRHLACWLGIMGPQDGVDVALRAVHHLVHTLGREDCHFAFLGFGDELENLRRLACELDLEEWVTFTGRATTPTVVDYLSTADVGLSPDPPTPFNDCSTMNKTMEYMAFGLPVVAFGLTETRVSAGPAAVYVDATGPVAFGDALARLLDDPERRRRMGDAGRQRVHDVLAWEHQQPRYVAVWDRLLRPTQPPEPAAAAAPAPPAPPARRS